MNLLQTIRSRLALAFPTQSPSGKFLRRVIVFLQNLVRAVTAPFEATRDGVMLFFAWNSGKIGIGKAASGRHIVMLVVSDLRSDPRVRREARALADAGYKITIIWPNIEKDNANPIDWGAGIAFEPLPREAGRFAYHFPEFLGRSLVLAARKHRPFAFHAHDLNTMLAALIVGRITGAHVVADHHEWFSESVVWVDRRSSYAGIGPIRKKLYGWLEQLTLRNASVTLTVCQSIAQEMETAGNSLRKVAVIRNIPGLDEAQSLVMPDLRTELGIQPYQQLIVYQGGIGPSRALEPVIRALAYAPNTCLMIRGPSMEYYDKHYRAVAVNAGVSARLFLLPPVPSRDVVAALKGADAGLYTVDGICKSGVYALPNKVFEYLYAGLPVLTVNYPEVSSLLIDTGVGIGFVGSDPASIGAAMCEVAKTGRLKQLKAEIPAVLAANQTDAEWQKLVALYDSLPSSAG
jgi:glycosyltransferase involved in cell wall biosynthesis